MEDERGPGLDFTLFCVRQSSARGCRFSVMFGYFVIKMFAGSRLLLPVYTNCVTVALHDLLTIRVNGCRHLHLSDAFIQSNLQCIQAIHFLSVCVFPGN